MSKSSPPPARGQKRADDKEPRGKKRQNDQQYLIVALYTVAVVVPFTLGMALKLPEAALGRFGILLTALATGVVAWFTWQLQRSTDRLWKVSSRQIGLARHEFLASHRPELVVRSFLFTKLPDTPDDTSLTDTYQITFWIANKGRSPATVISSRFQTFFGLTELIPGRNELLLNPLSSWKNAAAIIAPGANLQHDVTGKASSVRFAAMDMGMDTTDLYFLGRIVYADSEGTRREIGFGRRYNIKTGASAILTDPAIEYSD